MAFKELKAMEDVVILPADKRNGTVISNKERHNEKMVAMFETATFK